MSTKELPMDGEYIYLKNEITYLPFIKKLNEYFDTMSKMADGISQYQKKNNSMLPTIITKHNYDPDTYHPGFIARFLNYDHYPCDLYDTLKKIKYECIEKQSYKNAIIIIEQLPVFIRFIEKCYFYKNADTSSIYAEIKDNTETVYFESYDGIKAKFSFELTKIKKRDFDIFSTSNKDNYIKMINIEIKRTYGKQMVNTYKFVDGEFAYLEEDDIILLDNICHCFLTAFYKDTFCKTIKLMVKNIFHGRFEEYEWEGMIKDGLYVRKTDT